MATVPGDPSEPTNVAPMMPKWAQPTMADFLQAAAIMDQRGAFKTASNIVPDSVYSALSGYAQGGSASGVHKAMPEGWKANLRSGKEGVDVTAPDGKIHFIPNSDM